MTEKIYVVGGTGNIGTIVIQKLIKKGIHVTALVRDENKAANIFKSELSANQLHLVKGDYLDDDIFVESIKGHTRLFLLITGFNNFSSLKGHWGEIAYNSGVRQIVDISSFTVRFNRHGLISYEHYVGEENLLKASGSNNFFVALRPGFFMTNHFHDAPLIKNRSIIGGSGKASNHLAYIDTRDIGEIASVVLSEPMEKHGNAVYEIFPEVLTYEQKAALFSKVLGKEIKYVQLEPSVLYGQMVSHGMPHLMAYSMISLGLEDFNFSTPQIEILLGKKPRKLEDWIQENKQSFL